MNNNINKVLMMSNFQKEEYVSPEFETSLVEVEQGIAASSAIVLPSRFWRSNSGKLGR